MYLYEKTSLSSDKTRLDVKIASSDVYQVTYKTSPSVDGSIIGGSIDTYIDNQVIDTLIINDDTRNTATLTLDNNKLKEFKPGNPTLKAVFCTDDKYVLSSSTTINLNIEKYEAQLQTQVNNNTLGSVIISVTLKDNTLNKPIAYQQVTLTLPNGTRIQVTTNADGKVNIPLDIPVGTSNLTINYPGNNTYKAITEKLTVNVKPLTTMTTINILNNTAGSVRVGGKVTDANRHSIREGNVTIKAGNNIIATGKITNGNYNMLTSLSDKGTYTITATFTGTKNYLQSSASTRITINPVTPTLSLTGNGNNVGNTSITATVKDLNGKAIPKARVIVTLPNGTNTTTTTDNNGIASLPLNLKSGNNNITVTYPGNNTYNPIVKKLNIRVYKNMPVIRLNPVRGIIGETITLTAYLTDKSGHNITGGNLAFKLNGKTLRSDGRFDSKKGAMKLQVKNGQVKYTIRADLYLRNAKNLTASYSGNTKYEETGSPTVEAQIQKRYAQVTVTATPTRVKQYDTIKFTAKVKDTTRKGKNNTFIYDNTSVMSMSSG